MNEKTNFSKVIDKLPQNLTEMEKARWLYIELGKHFKYNMSVFYMSEEELGKIYNEEISIDEENSNLSICKPINQIYVLLLERMGISATVKEFPGKYTYNHVGTVIEFPKENMTIYTDLTVDLFRIQQGLRTENFAFTSPNGIYDILSRKELRDIDNKIGYTYLGLYVDEFVDRISEEMKDDETVRKYISKKGTERLHTSEKFEFLLKQMPLTKMGYVEARNFLIYLISNVFKEEDKRNISQYDLYREGNNGSKEFLNCIVIRDEEPDYYIQRDGKDILKISKDEMENLLKNGWKNRRKKEILEREDRMM